MAVTAVNAFAGGDDTNLGAAGTPYVTASYAFKNDHLYTLLFASGVASTPTDTLSSVTGGGITWAIIDNQVFNTIAAHISRITVLRGRVTSGAITGALTITLTGNDARGRWSCDEWSGEDSSGTNGSGAIVQSAKNAVDSPSTALTVTLSSGIGAGNASYGAFGIQARAAVTPGSGYTSLGTGQGAAEAVTVFTEYKSAGDTTPNVTYASDAAGGIALEIKAAAAAQPGINVKNRAIARQTWDPQTPQPFIGGRQPLEPRRGSPSTLLVPDPPFSHTARKALFQAIGQAWEPPLSQPTLPRYIPQPAPTVVADMPFILADIMPIIRAAWEPLPLQPQRQLPTQIVSVPIDNPPFNLPDTFPTIWMAWQQPTPSPWHPTYAPQQVQADNPPVILTAPFFTIIQAWQPPAPQPTQASKYRQIVSVSIDNPPFGIKPWIPVTIPDQQPQINLRFVPQVVSADNPPFGQRFWTSSTLQAWQPLQIQSQQIKYLPASIFTPVVDNPPFGQRPWLSTAINAWQPPYTAPGRAPFLAQEFTPAAANEPPYGLRSWLWPVLEAWEPIYVPQAVRNFLVQEGIAVPPTPEPAAEPTRPYAYYTFRYRERELERLRKERINQGILNDEAEVLQLLNELLPWLEAADHPGRRST